ncbi:MAG: AAA family ATPase [Sphaerochaeta sp.]
MGKIVSLSIEGFKSIKKMDSFELNDVNIFIGPNGSGKSNLFEIFNFIRAGFGIASPYLRSPSFNKYVEYYGVASDLLYADENSSFNKMEIKFEFENNLSYEFILKKSFNDRFLIDKERIISDSGTYDFDDISRNTVVPAISDRRNREGESSKYNQMIFDEISDLSVYHFYDVTRNSPIFKKQLALDCEYLKGDGSNIASFLLNLRKNHIESYAKILQEIKKVAPNIEDFVLHADEIGYVDLKWKQKNIEGSMKANTLSDGTIRFICLVTALLQPCKVDTIVIDEIELGMTPSAISILVGLIKERSKKTQILIATQSLDIISYFDKNDIVITTKEDGESTYRRMNDADFKKWMKNYSNR